MQYCARALRIVLLTRSTHCLHNVLFSAVQQIFRIHTARDRHRIPSRHGDKFDSSWVLGPTPPHSTNYLPNLARSRIHSRGSRLCSAASSPAPHVAPPPPLAVGVPSPPLRGAPPPPLPPLHHAAASTPCCPRRREPRRGALLDLLPSQPH